MLAGQMGAWKAVYLVGMMGLMVDLLVALMVEKMAVLRVEMKDEKKAA